MQRKTLADVFALIQQTNDLIGLQLDDFAVAPDHGVLAQTRLAIQRLGNGTLEDESDFFAVRESVAPGRACSVIKQLSMYWIELPTINLLFNHGQRGLHTIPERLRMNHSRPKSRTAAASSQGRFHRAISLRSLTGRA